MNVRQLTAQELRDALSVRDLTDPEQGSHALQLVVAAIETALLGRWGVPVHRHRASPVVTVADNYDRLGYPADAVTRDARYSRYVRHDVMLRAHTSANIPAALERLDQTVDDAVVACPGIVYRRDVIDRHHVGEPHQLDVWRVRRQGPPLREEDLDQLITTVLDAALPDAHWRAVPTEHPYTQRGRQVDVATPDGWVEVGECGLAHPAVLTASGVPGASGLASGWGLDRLVMSRKGIDDIRLLRATDARVASQLQDLRPYEPVSTMPGAVRDLSVAVAGDVDAHVLGDRIRAALGADAGVVEDVAVLAETPGEQLPAAARRRLGLRPGQRNVLLRVVLRHLDRTLTAAEANALRDRIDAAVHEGDAHRWAVTDDAG